MYCFNTFSTFIFFIIIERIDSANSFHTKKSSIKTRMDSRIVGGETAVLLEYPWIGSIGGMLKNGRKYHLCGASLINDEWAITAAHCANKNLAIYFGEYDLNKIDGTERGFLIDKQIVHKKYRPKRFPNDIALLKLNQTIDFEGEDKNLKIIELPNKNQTIPTGSECIVTGWGTWKINTTFREEPNILQKVSIPIFDQKSCDKLYRNSPLRIRITDELICAKRDVRKGACYGDSGGPLQCFMDGKWILIGIVAGGYGCNTLYPNIYIRVSHYLSWIQKTIENN